MFTINSADKMPGGKSFEMKDLIAMNENKNEHCGTDAGQWDITENYGEN